MMKYWITWKQKIVWGVLATHALVLVGLGINHIASPKKPENTPIFVRTVPLYAQNTTPSMPEPHKNPEPKPISPHRNPAPQTPSPSATPAPKKSAPVKAAPTPQKEAPPQEEAPSKPPQKTSPPPAQSTNPPHAPPDSSSPSGSDPSPGESKAKYHPQQPPVKTTTPSGKDHPPGETSSVPIPSLITPTSSLAAQQEITPPYERELVTFLQQALTLPEYGEVLAELTIDRYGTLLSCQILQAHSEKNELFLKKKLPELSYPWFNKDSLLGEKVSLTVVFRNEKLVSFASVSPVPCR